MALGGRFSHMLITIRNVLALVAVLSVPLQTFANGTIVAEPSVTKTNYCSAPKGDVVLSVSLIVKFRNDLDHPIILPAPSRVPGYELYSDRGQPGPKLPIRTQVLYIIHLVVRGPRVRPLVAGEYNLRVRIDPWPADQKYGKALARSWNARGELWIAPVTLPLVPLHIHETPAVEPCDLRVD
jgi:hypothetical protein